MRSIQEIIVALTLFISNFILPLLFALALLFFLWNVVRFFIIKGGDTASKDDAKRLALYGIAAFVFLVSIWGIVNMLVNGLDLRSGDHYVVPDYMLNDPYFKDWQTNCANSPGKTDCQ